MADTLQFDLVSPERSMVSGVATLVTAPGAEGDFGVMPGHAAFLTTLRPGVLSAAMEGGERRFVVFSGFAEVGDDHCTVLADDVHPADQVTAEMVDQRIAAAEKAVADAPETEHMRLGQHVLDLKALKDYQLRG